MMAVPLAFDAMIRAGSVGFMAKALNDAETKRANELLLRTFMSNLTPELSRTAARNGGVVHVTMQPSRGAVSA